MSDLVHIAVVLQFGVKDGEEELVVVLKVLQLEVLHGDGLGAVGVGDDLQGAALGHIAGLGRHGPEVVFGGDMDAGEEGQIRRDEIAKLELAVGGFAIDIADDEGTLVVGRHEEHRLHPMVVAEGAHASDGGDARQADGAGYFVDGEFVFRVKDIGLQMVAEVDRQGDVGMCVIGGSAAGEDHGIGAVVFRDGQLTTDPIVHVAVIDRLGVDDEWKFAHVEFLQCHNLGLCVFGVAKDIMTWGDVTVEDDGNAFVVSLCHGFSCQDDGILLSVVDRFGSVDFDGFAAHGHGAVFGFGSDVVGVVGVATGADHGDSANQHHP